jgi:MFS family permease
MESDLLLMAFSLLTWGFGESMFFYFIPLSLQGWGASPVVIGAVLGGIGLAAAIAQIPAGHLSDRYGPRSLMWAGWILGMFSSLMMAAAKSLTVFVIGIWIYYFTAFAVAPMNSYIILVKGKLEVGRALTFVSGFYNLGTIAGPIIGGLIASRFTLQKIYYVSFFIFVLSTLIILFVKPRKGPIIEASTDRVHLLKNSRYITLLILAFFVVMVLYLPQPLTSNYLQNEQHLSAAAIGTLGTIGNIGNTFATLILGGMNATAGMITGILMVAVYSSSLFWGAKSWVFGIGFFMLGGYRLSRSMMIARIRSVIRDHEVGLAFGILETINGAAIILTPVLAGVLYQVNPKIIYLISLPCLFILLIAVILFFRKKKLQSE